MSGYEKLKQSVMEDCKKGQIIFYPVAWKENGGNK